MYKLLGESTHIKKIIAYFNKFYKSQSGFYPSIFYDGVAKKMFRVYNRINKKAGEKNEKKNQIKRPYSARLHER